MLILDVRIALLSITLKHGVRYVFVKNIAHSCANPESQLLFSSALRVAIVNCLGKLDNKEER